MLVMLGILHAALGRNGMVRERTEKMACAMSASHLKLIHTVPSRLLRFWRCFNEHRFSIDNQE